MWLTPRQVAQLGSGVRYENCSLRNLRQGQRDSAVTFREIAGTAIAITIGIALAAGCVRYAPGLGYRLARWEKIAVREAQNFLSLEARAHLDIWRGTPKYFVVTGIDGTLRPDARTRALEAKGVEIVNAGCTGGDEPYNAVILAHFGVR